jgi:hypothetical protein
MQGDLVALCITFRRSLTSPARLSYQWAAIMTNPGNCRDGEHDKP